MASIKFQIRNRNGELKTGYVKAKSYGEGSVTFHHDYGGVRETNSVQLSGMKSLDRAALDWMECLITDLDRKNGDFTFEFL